MNEFVYSAPAARVVFGAGNLRHHKCELKLLGARRVLVRSAPEQRDTAEAVAACLSARAAGVFERAVMYVPIETGPPSAALPSHTEVVVAELAKHTRLSVTRAREARRILVQDWKHSPRGPRRMPRQSSS